MRHCDRSSLRAMSSLKRNPTVRNCSPLRPAAARKLTARKDIQPVRSKPSRQKQDDENVQDAGFSLREVFTRAIPAAAFLRTLSIPWLWRMGRLFWPAQRRARQRIPESGWHWSRSSCGKARRRRRDRCEARRTAPCSSGNRRTRAPYAANCHCLWKTRTPSDVTTNRLPAKSGPGSC